MRLQRCILNHEWRHFHQPEDLKEPFAFIHHVDQPEVEYRKVPQELDAAAFEVIKRLSNSQTAAEKLLGDADYMCRLRQAVASL